MNTIWRKRLLAVVLGLLAVEFLVFPAVARLFPLAALVRLPGPVYILGQSSKAGLLPRDYVLVLGDSYAEGQGDWVNRVLRTEAHPIFQATHLLHRATGRDVVTFGRGGADNISSVAYVPEKRFASLWRFGFPQPRDILIYFYGGNDLRDNLRQVWRRLGLEEGTTGPISDRELGELVESRARAGARDGIPGTFLSTYVLLNLFSGSRSLSLFDSAKSGGIEILPPQGEGGSEALDSVFRVGDQLYRFGPLSQGPGLDLTEDEVDLALRVLERTLMWGAERYAEARLTLIYIPAPLSCYTFESEFVEAQSRLGRPTRHRALEIDRRSTAVRSLVAAIAQRTGVAFRDATPALRSAATQAPIHGPRDGKHLNEAGYRALAQVLGDAVDSEFTASVPPGN